jgi:aconitate hydratase
MTGNSFNARERLTIGELTYEVFRLNRVDGAARLPYSLKVLLENLLRNEDGALVTAEQVNALGGWDPTAGSGTEIQFRPARVLLQDFTGVPCVVDLVAMRDAMADLGGDPAPDQPAHPGRVGHRPLGHRRRLRPRRRVPAQRRPGVRPQPGALPAVAVGAEILR